MTFVVSGKTYAYFDVPKSEYADFRATLSKGRYFNTRIRDHYLYEKLRVVSRARPTVGRRWSHPSHRIRSGRR